MIVRKINKFLKYQLGIYNVLSNLFLIVMGYRVHLSTRVLSDRKKISKKCTIRDNVLIDSSQYGNVEICAHVWIDSNVNIFSDDNIHIGEYTTINSSVKILGNVSIGSLCLIAPNCFISSGRHVFTEKPYLPIKIQDRLLNKGQQKIIICDDVWVGANVVVMPGVTIGKGAIIGANSVVTKDIPPYSVAVGSPAIVKRKRLNFKPPVQLHANDEKCFPYFYSGFEYNDLFSNNEFRSLGYKLKNEFTICVDVLGAKSLTLVIISLAEKEIQITVLNQVKVIKHGKNILMFNLKGVDLTSNMTIECKVDVVVDPVFLEEVSASCA